MNEKLDCEIVRDLMPLYVENLVSEKSKAAVEEHVKNCRPCSEILELMKAPEKRSAKSDEKEIDYLKKVKKSSKKGVLITVLFFVLFVILGFVGSFFYPGRASYYENLESKITVDGGTVKYSVSALNENECITKIKAQEKDGAVLLTVYCAPKLLFKSREKSGEYTPGESVKSVSVNSSLVWDNGYYTESAEYKLWKNKTPYCGDIVTDGKIADAVGVQRDFGSFTNELSTVKEPYGWRLFLNNAIEKEKESEAKKSMKSKACAILASIGNLSYVTFVYSVDGTENRFTVTSKQASEFVGKDIKLCTDSIAAIRDLLDKLEIE